ncbi:MAG: AAA family ATPase [Candidatus Dadabacteria bacterium]|nr:AAA family ATPase [Candidatus Dadabacteria bacterium]
MAFPTKTIETFVKAGYPIIYLVSWEEERVENTIRSIGKGLYPDSPRFSVWSCTDGLEDGAGPSGESKGLLEALDKVLEEPGKGFYFFKDIGFYLGDPRVVRKLKDAYQKLRKTPKTLFILASSVDIPPELEKEMAVIDIDLPDRAETGKIFDYIIKSHAGEALRNSMSPTFREASINALQGLGALEMELALRRTLVGRDGLGDEAVDALLEEKAQLVRKTGTLDFVRSRVDIDEVGGLENIKEWLDVRRLAFSSEAKEFGLDVPKGVLLMGISGCGKSLCAKAIATSWNLPLLRLDLNQVYSESQGSPEEAFRKAIKTVEATAPCVLWIDEIEAGITRSGEKSGDSPTSRIFGYFLTWMQEKKYPVFVTATANQIDLLPPEILRKGRFDEIFFVTLPNQKERREIFRIHLLNRGKNPADFDLDSLAKNTEGLSGAEIEQAVISALFESFSREKELTDRELIIAASSIVPLSTTMREEISKLERWASNRAVKASR